MGGAGVVDGGGVVVGGVVDVEVCGGGWQGDGEDVLQTRQQGGGGVGDARYHEGSAIGHVEGKLLREYRAVKRHDI